MKTLLKTICDHAFISLGGKLNIIGIFDEINITKSGAIHPQMSVALILNGEKNQKFSYYFDLEDPSGNKLVDTSNTPQDAVSGKNGNINIIINLVNLKLNNAGRYKIGIYAGDLREFLYFNVDLATPNIS